MKIAIIAAAGTAVSRTLHETMSRGHQVVALGPNAVALLDEIKTQAHPRQRFTVGN